MMTLPAFALDINLVRQGTTNKVNIRYTGADPCNLPRAFALVININSKAVITAVTDYKTGESISTSRGYGIYPATIAIEPNGNVTGWGTPIASDSDPLPAGADQVLPSKNIVLEFGSLYAPVHDWTNSPAVDGNLCTLTVDCNGASGGPVITMTSEATYRGGVVLRDRTTFAVNKSLVFPCTCCDCLNQAVVTSTEWNAWVQFGKPNCWCYKRQCRGDVDNVKSGPYWVSTSDLNILKSAFNKNDTILLTMTNGICADFDHTKVGLYRVANPDLNILKSNFNKSETLVKCCDASQDCTLTQPEKWNFWK